MSEKNEKEKPANSRENTGKFKPGQSGNPAGKKPGTKNKRTLAIADLCKEKDFNPLAFLIDTAKNEEIEWSHRIKAACEVNACVHPRLKAIEHSGNIGKNDVREMSEEELTVIANGGDN